MVLRLIEIMPAGTNYNTLALVAADDDGDLIIK
jgi:hypothetical protein